MLERTHCNEDRQHRGLAAGTNVRTGRESCFRWSERATFSSCPTYSRYAAAASGNREVSGGDERARVLHHGREETVMVATTRGRLLQPACRGRPPKAATTVTRAMFGQGRDRPL